MNKEGDFEVQPMCILDRKAMMLCNKSVGKIKVQWMCYNPQKVAWELEDAM
jgi:hypothetical protein